MSLLNRPLRGLSRNVFYVKQNFAVFLIKKSKLNKKRPPCGVGNCEASGQWEAQ